MAACQAPSDKLATAPEISPRFQLRSMLDGFLLPTAYCPVGNEYRPSIGCTNSRILGRATHPWPDDPIAVIRHDLPEHSRDIEMIVVPYLIRDPTGAPTLGPPVLTDSGQKFADFRIEVETLPAARQIQIRPFGYARHPHSDVQTVSFEVPRQAELTVGLGAFVPPGAPAASGVRFQLDLLQSFGRSTSLLDEHIEGARLENGWVDRQMSLTAYAGSTVRLRFRTTLDRNNGGGLPLWGSPQILAPPEKPIGPNFLLISIDTLRADMVDAVIGETPVMPFLRGIREKALSFDQATTTYPSTSASHMSLFTGLHPSVHQVRHPKKQLHGAIPTLAETLLAAGWQTAASTENGMLSTTSGFARGFNFYRETRAEGPDAYEASLIRDTFNAGFQLLQARAREPFFLFLHSYEVHAPYQRPSGHDLFPTEAIAAFNDRIAPRYRADFSAYAAEAHYTDSQLRALWGRLKQSGFLENTIVIITSDHGESFGEHGVFGHSSKMFDPVMRIPLIIHQPGGSLAPKRSWEPASLTDLMPTILSLAKLDPPAVTNGYNLLGRSSSGDGTDPEGSDLRYGEANRFKNRPVSVVARSPQRKTIASRGSENFAINLESDPHELHPLTEADAADEAHVHLENYEQILVETRDALGLGNTTATPPVSLDKGTRQRLEALGYLAD